jgi:hypothetical protein
MIMTYYHVSKIEKIDYNGGNPRSDIGKQKNSEVEAKKYDQKKFNEIVKKISEASSDALDGIRHSIMVSDIHAQKKEVLLEVVERKRMSHYEKAKNAFVEMSSDASLD